MTSTYPDEAPQELNLTTLQEMIDLVERIAPMKPPLLFTSSPTFDLPNMPQTYQIPPWQQQIRFPRSKKKRIRKKWRNQQKNYIPVDKYIITTPQILTPTLVHPYSTL